MYADCLACGPRDPSLRLWRGNRTQRARHRARLQKETTRNTLCHLAPRRLSECAARAKNASRSKKGRGKEAIFSTGVGKQRLKRLGATGRRAGPPTPRDSVLQTRKTHTRPPCASEAECYSRDVALSTARTRQSAARKVLRGGPLKGSATSAVPSLSISI